jgi:K+-sensing histidine kinase KdpD
VTGVTEGSEGATPVERDELARTISVVGLAVSQAADELQQAARRLSEAEERAREAEARVSAVETQLGDQAARVAEMLSLLQRSREGQIEAEERAREAEQATQRESERAAQAEEQLRARAAEADGAGRRLAEAEERARALEEQVAELEGARERIRALEGRIGELEGASDEDARATQQEVRELEERLREAEERLREAETRPNVTVILDDERTALQEAVAAEVRRPLTSILGITLALKHADPGSAEGRDMVKQLATNARKLDRLVGELLSIDRIAAGTFTPNLRRTDLEALVRRVVDESPDLANRDVEVSADHVAIQLDPGLAEQIVEVLLANAGRRTVPGSSVWVRVAPAEGGAVVSVDDTGPEIPAGLRQAMFAAATDDASEGQRTRGATGLSLLSKLADVLGGRCWVEERTHEGASFRVFLPDVGAEPEVATRSEVATDEHGPRELVAAEDEDEQLAV